MVELMLATHGAASSKARIAASIWCGPAGQQGASGFFSGYPRAAGRQEAVLPVADTWCTPRQPPARSLPDPRRRSRPHRLGDRINLSMPGVTASRRAIEALRACRQQGRARIRASPTR